MLGREQSWNESMDLNQIIQQESRYKIQQNQSGCKFMNEIHETKLPSQNIHDKMNSRQNQAQTHQIERKEEFQQILPQQGDLEEEAKEQQSHSETQIFVNMIEDITHESQQCEIFVNDIDMTYLFALLQNKTFHHMIEMKNSFKDKNDYLRHILPLFINENHYEIKMQCESFRYQYSRDNPTLPLRFLLIVDQEKTKLGKYLVLKGTEGDYDQEADNNTWKKQQSTDYQNFKDSTYYVVQLLVQQRPYERGYGGSFEFTYLVGVTKKSKLQQTFRVYLPWTERVINAFKIPNIQIYDSQYTSERASIIHEELINEYKELSYPNFDEIYPYEFLTHVNPIMKPSTYLIEISALMSAQKSPFFDLILQPYDVSMVPFSKKAEQFGQDLPYTLNNFFRNPKIYKLYNDSQRAAMIDACDYKKSVTIINGPPGTGKTFTSLGIMSAVLEHMRTKNQKGVILACAHSNNVINDWVRKIARASEHVKKLDFDGVPVNTIINSEGEPQHVKVLRIGQSDKCDPDVYDYALDIIAQRVFFLTNLDDQRKNNMDSIFQKQVPINKCYSLAHVRKRMIRTNEQIQELELRIYNVGSILEENLAIVQQYQLEEQKKLLKEIFQTMVELLINKAESYKALLTQYINGAQIIVTTLTSSVSTIFKEYISTNDLPIQLLIIDEAPQCYEPSILTPLVTHQVRKLVLIGDHKQLGPIVSDQNNSVHNLYSRSLYDRLIIKLPFFMLDTQYRSLPNLSAFTSQIFYNSKVKDAPLVCKQEFPQHYQGLLKQSNNFLFFDLFQSKQKFTDKKSYENEAEAFAVTCLVKHLIQNMKNIDDPQISVISPYKGQVQLIKRYLTYELKTEDLFSKVEVSTVDSFQGKENEIMIISLVRSEGVGFLKDPRRANVATSRAQYAQYIFGSKQAMFYDDLWADIFVYLSKKNAVVGYDYDQIIYNKDFFAQTLNQ